MAMSASRISLLAAEAPRPNPKKDQTAARQFLEIPGSGVIRHVALEEHDGVPEPYQMLAQAAPQGGMPVAPG